MIIGENVHHQDAEPANLDAEQITRIKDFISGAVYCWCKNNDNGKGEGLWFSADDLFGGKNSNWHGTPLQLLSDSHEESGSLHPRLGAWKDLRYILMKVIDDDRRRSYLTGRTDRGKRIFQWTGIDSHKPL